MVITGGGGCGKSILMRYLFLSSIKTGDKVPIFLELRELNQSKQSILSFIQANLQENHFKLDEEYINKALKNGHFAIFLDGFDELARGLRKDYSKQIQQLAKLYDKNIVIVSSRQDEEFSAWANFSVFHINPLDLEQACELVKKLPFEESFKRKFLRDLRETLFERHRSFLSNPLLLSIMLLTYGESADIPNRLNIFYNQAYEALFQRHDALKGAFQRERISNLNIQDFAKVFSAFSIQTYDKRLFQFTRSQALEYLEKSKAFTSLAYDSNDYLFDALQAVCLLIEEGLMIVFAHRSFQEYFTARFLVDTQPEIQEKLIEKYSKNITQDSVIGLLYEMKPELIEKLLIIPTLEKLEQQIKVKRKVGITHFLRFLKKNVGTIYFEKASEMFTATTTTYIDIIRFTLLNCGHLVGWNLIDAEKERPKTIAEEQNRKALEGTYRMSDLTVNDEPVRYLASCGFLLSIETLETVLKIKKALINKHINADSSIHQLLTG